MKKYIYKIEKKKISFVDGSIVEGESYEEIVFGKSPINHAKIISSWCEDITIDDYVKQEFPSFQGTKEDYAIYNNDKRAFDKNEHNKFVNRYNEQLTYIKSNLNAWKTIEEKRDQQKLINDKKKEIADIYAWIKATSHYPSEKALGETKWTPEKWEEFEAEYNQKKFVDLPKLRAELEVLENE